MKIGFFSDTHGRHNKLKIEPVDILICGGDFSNSKNIHKNEEEIIYFLEWFSDQPAKHKIFISGNHEMFLEKLSKEKHIKQYIRQFFNDLIYLEDSSVKIEGIKIYGSPWVPTYGNFAFMKIDVSLKDKYDLIEEDTDILITHGPAYGCLDDVFKGYRGPRVGSVELDKALKRLNVKYHLFGHIHEECGKEYNGKYHSINGAGEIFYFEI